MAHANGTTARGNQNLSHLVVGIGATSGVAQLLPPGQQQQLLQGQHPSLGKQEDDDISVPEDERDGLALSENAAAYRAAANIGGEEDDASAAVYSNDDDSECSSSDVVVVDQEVAGACGGVLDVARSKLVAGGMSPESADLIAELETPIQSKRRRVLNFGNVGIESSNGERTPVG